MTETARGERALLDIPTVAHRLSIGRSLVYELIRRGELPSVRVNSSRRVRAADLEAYVERLGTAA